MDNRERVIASLSHQQPDRIPYDVRFTVRAHEKMAEFYGDPDFASKLGNCLTWLGCEPADSWREIEPDIWQDQFGVRWDRRIDKDIGNVQGELVTPETLDEYQFPDPDAPSRYAWYDKILGQGEDQVVLVNLVFIHSCGKVDRVFPQLIECGVDVFNPFQPEVMDVFEIKRVYGSRLSFYGGVSVQKALPYGSEAEVREEVRRLLEEVGRDGGLIAAPSHSIPADAKPGTSRQ